MNKKFKKNFSFGINLVKFLAVFSIILIMAFTNLTEIPGLSFLPNIKVAHAATCGTNGVADVGSCTYTTAGADTFTPPTGVTSINVQCWGGGGGGGGNNSNKDGAGGGGGGAYAYKTGLTVTPGTPYNLSVGAGGTGGTTVPTDGNPGGNSTFNTTWIIAPGGSGGLYVTLTGGYGGAGGTGNSCTGGCTASYTGGNGERGLDDNSGVGGAGGGSAGTGSNGNGAAAVDTAWVDGVADAAVTGGGQGGDGGLINTNGSPGASLGGGGGGGGEGSIGGGVGGDGYKGKCVVAWEPPSITIYGTLYSDEGITTLGSKAIKVAISTSTPGIFSTTAAAGGTWSVDGGISEVKVGTPIVAWVEDGGTTYANTLTKASTTDNIYGVNLYKDRVIVKHEGFTGTSTVFSDFSFYNGNNNSNIRYSTTTNTINVSSGMMLYVAPGSELKPGASVALNLHGNAGSGPDGDFKLALGSRQDGTATSSILTLGGAMSMAGSWYASSTAKLNHGSQTITLTASTTGKGIYATTTPFYNLTLTGSGGTGGYWTMLGSSTIQNTLTIAADGTLDMSTYQLTGTLSSVSNSGTFKTSNTTNPAIPSGQNWGGTVEYAATAGSQYIPTGTYNNLTFDNTSNTDTAVGALTVNGALTTTSGGTLDMQAYQLLGTLSSVSNSGILKTSNLTDPAIPSGKTWGGTVQYTSSSGAQEIPAGTYNNLTFDNTSGTNTATGDLVVNTGTLTTTSNGTLDMTASYVLSGTATFTNGGTIKTSVPTGTSATPIPTGKTWAGTIEYGASAGSQTVVTGTYNNLTLDNTSGTNTAGDAITVNTALITTSGGTLDMSTYQLDGAFTPTNGGILKTGNTGATPIPASKTWGGTVEYNGAAGQTAVAGSFNNLTISNTAVAVTTTANISVGGALTVGGSADFSPSAGTITMTGGSITNSGTLAFKNLAIAGTVTTSATFSVTGDMTSTSGTLTTSGGAITVTGDLSVAGVITGTGNITVNGGDVTGNGTLNLTSGTFLLDGVGLFGGNTGWTFNELTFGDGSGVATTTSTGTGAVTSATTTIVANQTMDAGVSKTWNLTASHEPFQLQGTLLASTSSFIYQGANNSTTTPATYYNLEISPGSGSPTYLLGTTTGQTVTVNNDLTLGGAGAVTLNVTNYDPNLDINGSLTIGGSDIFQASNSSSFTVAGNFTNNGTFTANSGTLTLDTSTTAVISSTANMSFYNMSVTTPGKILQFQKHTADVPTFSFDNLFTVTGSSGNLVYLQSDTPGNQWLVDFNTTQTAITFTFIRDSGCAVGSLSVTYSGTNSSGGINGSCWNMGNVGADGTQTVTSVEMGSGGGILQGGWSTVGGGGGAIDGGSGGGVPTGGGVPGGGGGAVEGASTVNPEYIIEVLDELREVLIEVRDIINQN